jgi:hypothetical protein
MKICSNMIGSFKKKSLKKSVRTEREKREKGVP